MILITERQSGGTQDGIGSRYSSVSSTMTTESTGRSPSPTKVSPTPHSPVSWTEGDTAALDKARREKKPFFYCRIVANHPVKCFGKCSLSHRLCLSKNHTLLMLKTTTKFARFFFVVVSFLKDSDTNIIHLVFLRIFSFNTCDELCET